MLMVRTGIEAGQNISLHIIFPRWSTLYTKRYINQTTWALTSRGHEGLCQGREQVYAGSLQEGKLGHLLVQKGRRETATTALLRVAEDIRFSRTRPAPYTHMTHSHEEPCTWETLPREAAYLLTPENIILVWVSVGELINWWLELQQYCCVNT